ncbi:hypothetical protein [Enterococcus timonensis]|uniref:hypothetical protein n=1 Tax=Enterococcus timonensis TaxID=1852364 RepID=UPI0008D9A596|nr:hypothetical protein [Enterococcus timonensis]
MFTREDDDFILRQVKSLAQGLGKFLGKKSFYELLSMEQKQQVPESRYDDFLKVLALEEKMTAEQISVETVATLTNFPKSDLQAILTARRLPTPAESVKIAAFVDGTLR